MNNLHLFELMHAGPGLHGPRLLLAMLLAKWLLDAVLLVFAIQWVRGERGTRHELLQMLLAALLSLCIAHAVAQLWPPLRPSALHLGTQYLSQHDDAGLPSDPVTLLCSVGLCSLATRRFAQWSFVLLALGLIVGWSRVYLGAAFPLDVLIALPVAGTAAVAAIALRARALPAFAFVLRLYDRLERAVRAKLQREHGD